MIYIFMGAILFIILFIFSAIKLGKEADERDLKKYSEKSSKEQKI